MAFDPRGRRLATVGHDTLRLWWVATGEPILAPVEHRTSSMAGIVFFDARGERVATFQRGDDGPGLTWWDVESGRPERRVAGPGPVLSVSHDRRFVAALHGGRSQLRVWDV